MISAQLLSDVLGMYSMPYNMKIDENIVSWSWKSKNQSIYTDKINIYELAHMCKEWALLKQYYLFTWQREKSSTCSVKRIINTPPYVEEVGLYNMDTEPEAIFKACEWILKESK